MYASRFVDPLCADELASVPVPPVQIEQSETSHFAGRDVDMLTAIARATVYDHAIHGGIVTPIPVFHPDRVRDAAAKQCFDRLTRDFCESQAQNVHRRVPVGVLRSRRREQRHWIGLKGSTTRTVFVRTRGRVANGAVATGHGGEMAQRRVGIICLQFRQHVGHPRVERALAVFDEQTEHRAGEGFRRRPDTMALVDVVAPPDHSAVADDNQLARAVVADRTSEQLDGCIKLFRIDALRSGRGFLPLCSRKGGGRCRYRRCHDEQRAQKNEKTGNGADLKNS